MKPKALLPALLVLALAFSLMLSVLLAHHGIVSMVTHAAARLRDMGWPGEAGFTAGIFAVTLIGIVPGSVLGIAAGAIFGVQIGFLASAAGILAGAIAAFALSRSVFRPLITGALGRRRRLGVLDRLVSAESWRIVALLRISPVMPFSITSYALGLSGISARDYIFGTLASLPPLAGYVIIGALGGATLGTTTRGAAFVHLALLGCGAAATLALTIHLSRLLARALRMDALTEVERKNVLF